MLARRAALRASIPQQLAWNLYPGNAEQSGVGSAADARQIASTPIGDQPAAEPGAEIEPTLAEPETDPTISNPRAGG